MNNFSLRDSKDNLLFHEAIPSKGIEIFSLDYLYSTSLFELVRMKIKWLLLLQVLGMSIFKKYVFISGVTRLGISRLRNLGNLRTINLL